MLERRLPDRILRGRRKERKRDRRRLRRFMPQVRCRQRGPHRGRLHDGKLPVERVRRRHVHGFDQERLGDRRGLRGRDVPEVPRRFELQLRHRLHDERLLPGLVLRTEELRNARPLLRLGDGHLRKPAVVRQLQQLTRMSGR